MAENTEVVKAFVSCSLRNEDKNFVDYVCRILEAHGIKPHGTVGKFSASPENPIDLMNKNIPESDFVVICATPRYVQKDIKTGKLSNGLSEMIHVETGMAIAHNKPVVVFVQEGTDIGATIPNITQYITLDGSQNDFINKERLIFSLLSSAYQFAKEIKNSKASKVAGKFLIGGLAIYGGIKLLEAIFGNKD